MMDKGTIYILEQRFDNFYDSYKNLLSQGYPEDHYDVIKLRIEMNEISFKLGNISEDTYKKNIKKITKKKDELWEILVPASGNDQTFSFLHHQEWDAYVKSLANGLTIMKTSKGVWKSPSGEKFTDRMIPCRIATNDFNVINNIIDFTIKHYNQEAVMCYKISTDVIIRHKDEINDKD